MCLATDVPLIESGTTGFNGQVQVIRKVNAPSDGGGIQADTV
jgi:molybdopterin/thiamine biosynthesis adenylyltransferase